MIWTFIKADKFFPKYCPSVKSFKHKIRGKNGRGNPVEFSAAEQALIIKGFKQFAGDIIKKIPV